MASESRKDNSGGIPEKQIVPGGEVEKRKRGRPKKDENSPSTEMVHGMKAAHVLFSMGFKGETLSRKPDNSQSVSLMIGKVKDSAGKLKEQGILMMERGDQIAIYTEAKYCNRSVKDLVRELIALGFDF